MWIFGGVDRENPTNCFATKVDNAEATSLIPIIQKCILPGTTIVSKRREEYYFVSEMPENYTHLIEPTSQMERFWDALRDSLASSHGKYLEPLLQEFSFRRIYPRNSLFYVLLVHITALFPLHSPIPPSGKNLL